MKLTKEYLNVDPYTRLSNSKNKAQKMLSIYGNSEDEYFLSQDSTNLKNTQSCSLIKHSSQQIEDFCERQSAFEAKKQEKRQKQIQEITKGQVPKINKKSKEIAKTLVDFNERNEVLLNRKENLISKREEKEFPEKYTFHPQILPQSKKMNSKTVEEMSYVPMIQKERNITRIKEGMTRQETGECTFKPNIGGNKKYSEVQSKLQLNENIDTYLERINLSKQMKDNIGKIYQQEREYQEIAECTHKPQITELPYYMKIKQEIESRVSQSMIGNKKPNNYLVKYNKFQA